MSKPSRVSVLTLAKQTKKEEKKKKTKGFACFGRGYKVKEK